MAVTTYRVVMVMLNDDKSFCDKEDEETVDASRSVEEPEGWHLLK